MEALGAVNQYAPYRRPGRSVWTVNLAAGTTPFIHLWDGQEFASACYRLPHPDRVTVSRAHYRPDRAEFDGLAEELQEHVLNGGLLCAPLAEARQLPDDPVRVDWGYERFQAWCLAYYGRRLPPLPRAGG